MGFVEHPRKSGRDDAVSASAVRAGDVELKAQEQSSNPAIRTTSDWNRYGIICSTMCGERCDDSTYPSRRRRLGKARSVNAKGNLKNCRGWMIEYIMLQRRKEG